MAGEIKIIETIYEAYKKMLDLSNELNDMQKEYDSRMLNKDKEYEGKYYDEMQYKELTQGLDEGIDVSLYASADLSHMSMSMIRAAIKSGADVKEIVNPDKKFNEKQIAVLCSAAVTGLYDIKKIAYPHLDADRMLARITGKYIRGDMPDTTMSIRDMEEYGYISEKMLPLGQAAAFYFYDSELPVMLLYPDGTDAYVSDRAEIEKHAENSGIFGIEKYIWEHELHRVDNEKFTHMLRFSDIVKDGSTYYAIYQITDEADERLNIIFRNKEDIDRRNIPVDFENYKLVYAAKTEKLPNLESIYQQFNTTYAEGFYGHSLSVSDVIVMKDKAGTSAYYVDTIGFKDVPEFAKQFSEEKKVKAIYEKIKENQREDIDFSNNLDAFISNNRVDRGQLIVGKTPYSLVISGATQNLDITISPKTIKKCMAEPNERYHGHGLSADIMRQLPKQLRNPVMVLKGSQENSLVAITSIRDKEDHEIMVALNIDATNRHQVVNQIASVYGKDNMNNYLAIQLKQGNLIAANKEKAEELTRSLGLQLPPEESFVSFNDSIAYSMENIKYPENKKTNKFNEKEDNSLGNNNQAKKPATKSR